MSKAIWVRAWSAWGRASIRGPPGIRGRPVTASDQLAGRAIAAVIGRRRLACPNRGVGVVISAAA